MTLESGCSVTASLVWGWGSYQVLGCETAVKRSWDGLSRLILLGVVSTAMHGHSWYSHKNDDKLLSSLHSFSKCTQSSVKMHQNLQIWTSNLNFFFWGQSPRPCRSVAELVIHQSTCLREVVKIWGFAPLGAYPCTTLENLPRGSPNFACSGKIPGYAIAYGNGTSTPRLARPWRLRLLVSAPRWLKPPPQ